MLSAGLTHGAGLGWKNQELDRRLRERLPKSYSLYLEGIKRVQEIMGQIKDHLGVADNQEPSPREGRFHEVNCLRLVHKFDKS